MSGPIDPTVLAQIKAPDGYHVVVVNGEISIEPDKAPTTLIDTAKAWTSARVSETSTHAGVAGGAALTPLIINAVTAALAGDIVGAITSGVPALIGLAGAIAAIITPNHIGQSASSVAA
ncbi:MAG: hypothetical protein WCL60_01275 [Methylococcales bacterium]